MNPDFWKGRRVFVTGHTGFKGSWLCLVLARLGAVVSGYALDPPTRPSLFEEAGVGGKIASTIADVRDFARLSSAMDKSAPEIVLHLAAQAIVRRSFEEPLETFETNVMGAAHLLEAVRQSPSVRAVCVVTSDKCYENREWDWPYRESDRLGGHDPYSASKGCQELVAASFWRSFFEANGVFLATARAGNVIGGGDWAADRLVPDLARAAEAGSMARVRNPRSVRPWQHVLDPLNGYLMLCERLATDGPAFSGAWNFGPADPRGAPVSVLAERFFAALGKKDGWAADTPGSGPHEARLLTLDVSKARARLGWAPVLCFEESVEWTARWYQARIQGRNVADLTMDQIARFLDRAGRNP